MQIERGSRPRAEPRAALTSGDWGEEDEPAKENVKDSQ